MKILFLTVNGIEDATFGGAKASIRNYESLCKYGEVDVITVRKKSNMASVLSMLQGYFPPIDEAVYQTVKMKLAKEHYDLVFFDGSHFGSIVQYVKSCKVPSVVFFHNCEQDYLDVRLGTEWSLKKWLYRILIRKEEKKSALYADQNVVLTKRDAERIRELYGVENEQIIPLSLKDSFVPGQTGETKEQRENTVLLFGPVGHANEEAFSWFVDQVSPFINGKTLVAGKGFDAYQEQWETDKVEVTGFVEDIGELYASVDCVAIPLLSGGGMKIKTTEAMMHGKYIFGTDEAFVGFEVDYDQIGGLCNSAEEYIQALNDFWAKPHEKMHGYARALFEEKYSMKASEKEFDSLMEKVCPRK